MSAVRRTESRSRQVEIYAGYRALLGHNSMYLSELRKVVKATEDCPENSRVQVEKSGIVGDRIKVIDERRDWADQ